jgi:hypothetical protein
MLIHLHSQSFLYTGMYALGHSVSIVFSFSVKELLSNFIMSDHRDFSLLCACIKDVLTLVVLHVEVF